MFKSAKKEDLRLTAVELGMTLTDSMTVIELTNGIKNTEAFKNEPDVVKELINGIIEERKIDEEKVKSEQQNAIELEKIKLENNKVELELAKVRAETRTDAKISESEASEKCESLDSLIKSMRTLTIRVPSNPEGWGFFFASLERAFLTKNVPEKLKAEILLNLLGERASNVITYIKDDELCCYTQVKSIVLREYEPTAQFCIENFRRADRQVCETFLQFSTRLTNSFDYYLSLRKVVDFETLKQLIVSDKLYQTLDRETASHISVRQADGWFKPIELGREIDLYFTSRGKSTSENSSNFNKKAQTRNTSKVFLSEVTNSKCACDENHLLYKCNAYKSLPVNERIDLVKKNNLCFSCLNSSHKVFQCKSKYSCSICKKRHHSTLHLVRDKYPLIEESNVKREKAYNDPNENEKRPEVGSKVLTAHAPQFNGAVRSVENVNNIIASTSLLSNHPKTVLLGTVVCYARDVRGNLQPIRGIIDSGSMCNILSLDCVDKLGLKKEKINILVQGINEVSMSIKFRVSTVITNKDKSYGKQIDFLVVPRIMDIAPSKSVNFNVQNLTNVKFADENFNIPGRIDILLGADIFYNLLRPGQIKPDNSSLILQNTVFGFVVSGSVPTAHENKIHCGLVKDEANLNEIMEKFWEIESVEHQIVKPKETIVCEEHFLKNHIRDENGRYMVKMPFKEDPICLGESKEIALKKLNSLWERLKKDKHYLQLYREFLEEYEKLGHMREVQEIEEPEREYYIPHLGVYNPGKSTTKLRVVFNASSPTANGKSLNSLQYNGGIIQEDLLSIMMRFRTHIIALIADIKMMYRQILIHPDQRSLQRILWKSSMQEPIKTYELSTLTYGTVCAPYLAQRVLMQLATDEDDKFPLAATTLKQDCYMDDILTGEKTLSRARDLQKQLVEILRAGGMELHKWNANHKELAIGEEMNYQFSNPEETKVLGISWNPKRDSFSFRVILSTESSYTKRNVLSTIAKIFDPLGLLGPIISSAKIFMQQLWKLKLNWDDPLPEKETKQWQSFIENLHRVNELEIGRCILREKSTKVELHGFADASESAYGAVIYCKSTNASGEVTVKLVISKSRVSPIKTTTIPRLELNAAVLLVKLMNRVKTSLKLDINDIYLWSDSMIVLAWIRKEPYKLKTFIANRVSRIQELSLIDNWRHVSSQENPADLVSRGVDAQKFLENELWFQGPKFLIGTEYPNREIPVSVIQDSDYELKNSNDIREDNSIVLKVSNNSFINDLLCVSNNYNKIIRVISYIFRFSDNCKSKHKNVGPLSLSELNRAELILAKIVQKEEFRKEFQCIHKTGEVSKESQVRNLNPFIDELGVLRVGGRLSNSDLKYDHKFPILLPAKHRLTNLIVEYYHNKYLHVGPQALLFQIRRKFWPLNGRDTCRKIVHNCIVCFKTKPITCQQIMGDLPKERVNVNFPFNCAGVDFCGPFMIKYKHQRKGVFHKIYVAIFVCFATKAVHLELVTDLTSEAFIATLKRFFARRGKSATLFSDNATNFIGSNAELKKLHRIVNKQNELLSGYLSNESVEWKFIPPRAPNFGGLWEAGVKAFKYHLKRVVGKCRFTYEEFLTITIQIEGILNSRPLNPLTSDINDLNALTPGHFLLGRPITSIVEPDLTPIVTNKLDLYQKVTKVVQTIWKKWSNNYLSSLQQRSKWLFTKNNVKVGDMVLVKEDNLAVCNWQLGRLLETYPGKDNKVRVVSVRTTNGVFKRPITKICVLPIEN